MCSVLSNIFYLYFILLLIRALMSWVNPDPYNPIVRVINMLTEPVLAPFRRIIPPIGMFDISFIVAILALQLGEQVLLSILRQSGLCF